MRTTLELRTAAIDAPTPELTRSVIPAIDDAVGRCAGRGLVAASEVVDMLLDLRLLAEADELVASRA